MTTNTTISPSGAAVALAGAPAAIFPMAPVIEVGADQRVWLFTWAALINGAVGLPIGANGPIPFRSAFFQATGTFGADGSVQIEGSNDNVNWYALSPAALTEAGVFTSLGVQEHPAYLRPHVTAGDSSTALTISAFVRM
ncbi:MAG: hypothetical protein WAU56_07430 [Steroidobacteraceae bacterium]